MDSVEAIGERAGESGGFGIADLGFLGFLGVGLRVRLGMRPRLISSSRKYEENIYLIR